MIVVLLLLIILVAAGLYSIGSKEIQYSEALDLTGIDAKVTADKYEKIEMGMSQEDVESIIGGKGKLMYEDEYRVEYSWPGEYYSEGSEHFRLDTAFSKKDNTLIMIDADNIVFGEKAKEYEDMQKSEDFSGLNTVVIKKQQLKRLEENMSYIEVSSVMGGEGIKAAERTIIQTRGSDQFRNYEKRTFITYAWKSISKEDQKPYGIDLTFEDDKLMWLPIWALSPDID